MAFYLSDFCRRFASMARPRRPTSTSTSSTTGGRKCSTTSTRNTIALRRRSPASSRCTAGRTQFAIRCAPSVTRWRWRIKSPSEFTGAIRPRERSTSRRNWRRSWGSISTIHVAERLSPRWLHSRECHACARRTSVDSFCRLLYSATICRSSIRRWVAPSSSSTRMISTLLEFPSLISSGWVRCRW